MLSTSKGQLIALIPARLGSKRIKNKNIKKLNGHPLISYTINVAISSGLFERVIVSTDSNDIADIARLYGAEVPFLRSSTFARDSSPDIDWLSELLNQIDIVENYKYIFILRPTSPFRTVEMLVQAWEEFRKNEFSDTLRAVEKCSQHPGKMWTFDEGEALKPLLPQNNESKFKDKTYNMPTQELDTVFVQNASLEILTSKIVQEKGSLTGDHIQPFFTSGYEGFDINYPIDWDIAEQLIKQSKVEVNISFKDLD